MTAAFTKRERTRLTQHRFAHRPTNNWGDGDLPAPWAAGDIVQLFDSDAPRLETKQPGFYVVCTAFSIDEGDGWYFRICGRDDLGGMNWEDRCSNRLHVFYGYEEGNIDYMAPFKLIETGDPDGLARRARMLAEGWTL